MDEVEAAADRRRRAARLFAEGMSRARVARALGVCRATATRWYRRWEAGGAEALAAGRSRGRPPKLDAEVMAEVLPLLEKQPRELGFEGADWSLDSIVALLARTTGVSYHARHVTRVLRRHGWVVPPVGPGLRHAFRARAAEDPDGNPMLLRRLRPSR